MEKEKKKINKKKLWLITILVSIVLVPTLYGFTYLKSYWSLDTSVNKVPIAVVNLDVPYTKDGKTYDIGSTVINNLKTNTSLDWQFVDYDKAKNGVYGDKYYAMIVIPKDFSELLANATTDGFKKPQIDFYQNQGKNFVFSEISGIGVQQLQENISQSISKSVSKALVETLYQTKDGFKTAASGSVDLVSGINKLNNGSKGLVSGMDKLQNGSTKLTSGVDKLQEGSSSLVSGMSQLNNGSSSLVSGVSKLQNGSDKLVSGMKQLDTGSENLVSGVSKLQNGSNALADGMQKISSGSSKLAKGSQVLSDGSQNLVNGMQQLQNGATKLSDGEAGISKEMNVLKELLASGQTAKATELLNEIQAQTAKLQTGASSLKAGINSAQDGASRLNSGISSLNNGIDNLNSGIQNANVGATKLNNGISSARNGAIELNNGIGQIYTGASTLSGGLDQVATGATKLNDGISSALSGSKALNGGLTSAKDGVTSLTSGIASANNGAQKLSSGLNSANTGAKKLSNGLENGYKQLNNNLNFTSEQMSEFISNPVVLNTIAINPVSSYGEGFAPYFMCIALWVGSMYVYYMVSALSRKFEGSFTKRFLRLYLTGTVLTALQALIMSFVIYKALGLQTTTPYWFFGVNILTAIAIYSFMVGLHYLITPIMKGALVVIMVVEFTACGGSYPVLAMPAFYKLVHPFLLLSYSVSSMRMAISGINYNLLYKNIGALFLFIVGSLLVGYLVGYLKNHITHKRVLRERSELIDEKEAFNQYV